MSPVHGLNNHNFSARVGAIEDSFPIDKNHPLSKLNPELERILAQLSEKILKVYLRVEDITNSSYTFEPVMYATQVVAGTNYYVKMRIIQHGAHGGDDDAEYIHVRVFDQPWTKTLELTGLSIDMALEDPFEYDMCAPPE